MPSAEGGAADEEAPAEPVRAIEVPRNLNLSLNTDLRKVLFEKMTIGDISGEMRVAGGALSLERSSAAGPPLRAATRRPPIRRVRS